MVFQKGNQINKGRIPWNKDKKNIYSEDTLKRMSRKGKPNPKVSKKLKQLHKEGKIIPYFLGKKLSEEHKRKISETEKKRYSSGEKVIWNKNKKNVYSKDTLKRMYLSKKGLKINEEQRKNLSKALKGRTLSEEWKRKISESHKGMKHTEKSKKKIGEKSKFRIHTLESKRKISKSLKGRIFSKITREKLSKVRKGITLSEETKKKISSIKQGIPLEEWKEFIVYKPYTLDFNKEFKELIRERDNNSCVVCNTFQEDLNYKLSVHHIDYDKKNSFQQNCVSLCRRCHANTNINRTYWKTFFQSLLKERYNYEYTQDQKIILDFNKEEIK